MEMKLLDIDDGAGRGLPRQQLTKDWDGNVPKIENKSGGEGGEGHNPKKIYAMYNAPSIGVSALQRKAEQFINVLSQTHEESGLKSWEEELILLFLRCNVQLRKLDRNNGGEKKKRMAVAGHIIMVVATTIAMLQAVAGYGWMICPMRFC